MGFGQLTMIDAFIFQLPEQPTGYPISTYWWAIVDGKIVAHDADESWPERALSAARRIIALAPSAAVRVDARDRPADAASDRQAETIARLKAVQASLGEAEALHAVAAARESQVITAVVDNGVMLGWLDWSRSAGIEPDVVVPTAALVREEEWTCAEIGADTIVVGEGRFLPGEPELVAHLADVGDIRQLDEPAIAALLVSAAANPPLNLRQGRFAKRRRFIVDARRVRELALLAAAIPLVTLLWAIASIVMLDRSTDRLDAETAAVASAALGHPVAFEEAETALRQRQGSVGGGLALPLSALYRHLQSAPGVSATVIGYRRDGTLSTTLAAPTVDEVNGLLLALQRDAFRITAVPRQSADGRSMVDVTIRGAP